MATPVPTREATFTAYCATSMRRASRNTAATPAATEMPPTPTGSTAATREPKTSSSTATVKGAEYTSARMRSPCITWSRSPLKAA